MKAITYLIVAWLAIVSTLATAQHSVSVKASKKAVVTVQTVERSIAKIGGKATVLKYFFPIDDTPGADAQLERIDSGDKQWVDLAVRLLPYSDAGSREGLLSSLGTAMQKQPRNVLPYVGKSSALSPDQVCVPFISGEVPVAEQLKVLRLSKAAISSVHDPALSKQCQACLKEVAEYEKAILANSAKKK